MSMRTRRRALEAKARRVRHDGNVNGERNLRIDVGAQEPKEVVHQLAVEPYCSSIKCRSGRSISGTW